MRIKEFDFVVKFRSKVADVPATAQALVPGSLLARCSLGAASTISQDGETGLSQRPDHDWTVSVSNSELGVYAPSAFRHHAMKEVEAILAGNLKAPDLGQTSLRNKIGHPRKMRSEHPRWIRYYVSRTPFSEGFTTQSFYELK